LSLFRLAASLGPITAARNGGSAPGIVFAMAR